MGVTRAKPAGVPKKAPKKVARQMTPLNASGAAAALTGYEYQLNVSVLAALRLLLVTQSTDRVTLEPANHEDLEADLEVARPGRVVTVADLNGRYKLVVQVKFSSGNPWTIQDFDALLNHGVARPPAKNHLNDPTVRYLLITNADVTGVARDLIVKDFEEAADPLKFPASLKSTLPGGAAGRVAIWSVLTEKLITHEINDILTDVVRIPRANLQTCLEKLRGIAREKMRGSFPGVWGRADLLVTMREHGGFLASAAELECFVRPSNFDAMLASLRAKNAIIIAGRSGTGKTLAALALCEEARRQDGGLQIITVNPDDSPGSTRRLTHTGPILYYIEDPWGQYSLLGGSENWSEQLPRLLQDARPGQQYVITSRSDMLDLAGATDRLKSWSTILGASHYEDGQLESIYEKRTELLPGNLQIASINFKKRALAALETPLELRLFFYALTDGPLVGEAEHAFFSRLIGLAHREAVTDVVMAYLKSIGNDAVVTVIWALLTARGTFNHTQIIAVQRQLRMANSPAAQLVGKVIARLVATGHLRQPHQQVSFAHPSVRAGFETYLKKNWIACEETLKVLVCALVELEGAEGDWGMETAAYVLVRAKGLPASTEEGGGAFCATPNVHARIDTWLEKSLVHPTSDFQPLLQLAASIGGVQSCVSELARWFVDGIQRGGEFFNDNWESPTFDDAWYERISAAPLSKAIVERFICEQLPGDDGAYDATFLTNLDRIASGLAPAFLTAARSLIGYGHSRSADIIAAGALRDLAAYEAVLAEAIDDVFASDQRHGREGDDEWVIADGVLNSGAEESYGIDHDDLVFSSHVLIDTYIKQRRSSGSWLELGSHERVNGLAWNWAQVVLRSDIRASSEEILAIVKATEAIGYEHTGWDAARAHWVCAFDQMLIARILSLPNDLNLRRALAACMCVAAPSVWKRCVEALADRPCALVILLVDLHAAAGQNEPTDLAPWLQMLTPVSAEIFKAMASEDAAARAVGASARSLLETAALGCPPTTLQMIVPILIASGTRPVEAIRRWMNGTTEAASAEAATNTAISIGENSLIWLALDHARADARERALAHLARNLPDPLPPKLLNLATDRGSRVRQTLITILGARPHPDHLLTVLQLTRDRWDSAVHYRDERETYPIACDAIDALAGYGLLSDDVANDLIDMARKSADFRLTQSALRTVIESASPDFQHVVWGLVAITPVAWLNVFAIEALGKAPVLEPTLLAAFTVKKIMGYHPQLAVAATNLISLRFPVAEAVRMIEQIGNRRSHRALLLVGATTLAQRDRPAAVKLLALLGEDHPARRFLDADAGLLPGSVLDDLGSVRIRRAVQSRLKHRFSTETQ